MPLLFFLGEYIQLIVVAEDENTVLDVYRVSIFIKTIVKGVSRGHRIHNSLKDTSSF